MPICLNLGQNYGDHTENKLTNIRKLKIHPYKRKKGRKK